jgi:transposase
MFLDLDHIVDMAGLGRSDLAQRRKQMAEDAQQMDINLVAKKWKVTRTTVVNACREHGLKVQVSQKEQAVRRKKMAVFAEKNGVDAAAQEFGVSISTVYGACRENGISLVRKPQIVLTEDLAIEQHQHGHTVSRRYADYYTSDLKYTVAENQTGPIEITVAVE